MLLQGTDKNKDLQAGKNQVEQHHEEEQEQRQLSA